MKLSGILPIGSVVKLKESNKRLMIIGCMQQQTDTDKVWDYAGVPYPEGFIGAAHTYLFDQVQIARVFALGFQDEEQFAFSSQVDQLRKEKKRTPEN